MTGEPKTKAPRTAGDILREMAERAKAKRPAPLPPEDAPPPPTPFNEAEKENT